LDLSIDTAHLQRQGWVRVRRAIPEELCGRLVEVLERELSVPVHDPARWPEYGAPMRDLIPIWGHQTQWDIRQHPNLHRIWATLWGIDALRVSLDSCRFTPPWQPGYAEPYGLHWDHAPRALGVRFLQGVLALTDTAVDQGGWRCIPSLYHAPEKWPEQAVIDADGDEGWPADASGREIVYVPAATGDLIIWDSHLPHGNSKNLAARPRLAFYVSMFPTDDRHERERLESVESWRTGRCVSWWRGRPGYDRVEPWRPAKLTPLGRRLLGIDPWPKR
jgi:Phytanoyl-CoA dioxygenase (PhyH)